ncbi:MAG: NAD(P)-binding protein [Candidatus Lokiarchaeota archaeon]|nr:NAD(P)-binding protein [Candidatus Lokiarchaeota archaeon]MBD3201446.1 NAD(P)-binding protein [Candidatus Lokiarchaeota archaeon]
MNIMENLNQSIEEKFDAAIIGAGNGGLVAATQLALENKKIILFEQHNLPGGFATSFKRGRFEFEASLHELCDYGPESNKGGIYKLFDELGIDIPMVKVPEAYRLILTDPEEKLDIIVPFGVENYINTIIRIDPESETSVKKFISLLKEVHEALNYIRESKGNADKKVLMSEYGNFLRTAAYSLDDVLEALDVSETAQKIIKGYWVYLAIPTDRINFTIYAAMLYFFLIRGAFIPRYRSSGYTMALENRIRDLGGRVEYNTKVEKINVKDGKVIGLETSNGDKIQTNYVISNASPTLVYNDLINPKSERPEIGYKFVNARRHAVSCLVIYLGLNKSADELGLNEYSYVISDNMDTNQIYESFNTLEHPKVQATICLNNAIPDCSPEGTCILSITSFFRPEAWKDVKKNEYFALKDKIAIELIKMFESATNTKISDYIEEMEVATPETYVRYTGSYNGVTYGYEVDSWDSTLPRLMRMNEERFIDGLKICGGFSFQGVSYTNSLLSGQITALLTLQDMMNGGDTDE